MTSFCDVVTSRDEVEILAPARFVTKEMGEAMASAPGFNSSGGAHPGAGVKPSFPAAGRAGLALALAGLAAGLAVILGAGCGEDPRPAPPTGAARPLAPPSVADLATGVTTELDGIAPAFGDAVIAELAGDPAAARIAFQQVLDAPDAPAPLAARAALHLAQLAGRAGRSRDALDLSARAAALAPNDAAITEGVAQVQADVVAASGGGDLRGPKAGTSLPGVEPRLADAFARAERALVRVHAIRPRQRLEIWAKEDATEELVATYRAVRDKAGERTGAALVRIAADYRIGSLDHDLALGLLFGGALEQRGRALAYLKLAATAYRASLAGPAMADAELWRLAAETDLRNARDVLAAAGATDASR